LCATLGRALATGVDGLRRLGEEAQRRSVLFSTEAAAEAIAGAVVAAYERQGLPSGALA
jgi:hypothetical protein